MDSSSSRSTTAEGAAFCRALGALERSPNRRNPDGLAHHFVTRTGWRLGLLPLVRELARWDVERRLPGALLLHHVRTRLFDELTRSAADGGASQIVVLGAGADSRAYRLPELRRVRVFEVDHPETGSWKQARVRRMLGTLPDHVRYVPIDFTGEPLATALARAGFDTTQRTFFLWEGVTMYLPIESVDAVLSWVARSVPDSAVAFDYVYAEAITHPTRFAGARAHAEFAASRGEPFTFGLPEDTGHLTSFLAARGLALAESWSLRALYPGDGFPVPFVGIVHARVAPSVKQGRQSLSGGEPASVPG